MLHTFLFALLALAGAATPGRGAAAFTEDVPYVGTPPRVVEAMLDIAGVRAGDHVIDLGSGDGRIVVAAARRGATALGVDNDPALVAQGVENARLAGVTARATFLEQDLFATDLAPATVVTLYLLPEVNLRLRPALLALRPGTRVVSHDWDMGEWIPDRSITLSVPEKAIGVARSSRVHLWVVPASVEGVWCATLGQRRATLRLRQSYQYLQGELASDGALASTVTARIDGSSILLVRASPAGRMRLQWRDGRLRTLRARGSLAALREAAWLRGSDAKGCAPE